MKKKLSRKKAAELHQKAAVRKFRAFAVSYVLEVYVDDEPQCVHGDDILDAFVMQETQGKHGSGLLRALLTTNVKKAIKDAMRYAIEDGGGDGIGVLVTEDYFDLDDDDFDEALNNIEVASSYVAGRGRGRETVGIHFIYGDSAADCFWKSQFNHRVQVTNGVNKRLKSEASAGNEKKLAGFGGNSTLIKTINSVPQIPLIGSN